MLPKPMLAVAADLENIKFPCIVSPKIDGVRCLMYNGVAYSRKLKPLPNKYIQEQAANAEWHGLDGEITVGASNAEDVMRATISGVMSEEGKPDFLFWAFDRFDVDAPYIDRFNQIPGELRLESYKVNSLEELHVLEEEFLEQGYEGLMVRSPDGPYKQGRSTVREGYLLKVKRFCDDEAPIVGFEPKLKNNNKATKDNLGRTKRSSHKENMIAQETLGSFILELPDGQLLNVGSGLTDEERLHVWNNKELYLGKLCKYKYTPIGMKDLPRFPTYLGIRPESDLD